VVRMDPNNQYALLYLQKLHEEQHQWADAHRIRKQLVALSGPDTQPRNQAILAFLENALGSEALGVGDRGRAARHFEEAIDLDAGTVPAFLNLGDVRLMQGDIAGAEDAWDRLMTSSPERAYLAFGRLEKLYEQLGQPHKFEERCLRLITVNPQDWRARLALGGHLAKRGRDAEAFEFLVAALEHNPHGLTVHQAVWGVLLKLDLSRTLVQRYIESARSSVFFLDPHVCVKCHYRSTELLWQCPHCHEWNSFVEERIAPAQEATVEM
jgi:lipopolysaccharide biosynthesis regulator YciM